MTRREKLMVQIKLSEDTAFCVNTKDAHDAPKPNSYAKCKHIDAMRADNETHCTWLTRYGFVGTDRTSDSHSCKECILEIEGIWKADPAGEGILTLWRLPKLLVTDQDVNMLMQIMTEGGNRIEPLNPIAEQRMAAALAPEMEN